MIFRKDFKFALILILACIAAAAFVSGVALRTKSNFSAYAENINLTAYDAEQEYVYLSEIPYDTGKSYASKDPEYGTAGKIVLDAADPEIPGDGLISLTVDKTAKKFLKGITACAPSEVVYDLSSYNYDWFSTYYGVDASMSYGDYWLSETDCARVKFYIYTSVDGENWVLETEEDPPVKKGEDEASFITIDIKNKKYLKLKAVNAGKLKANHSVYVNPRLYKDGFVVDDGDYEFIKTVAEYDEIIKNSSYDELLNEKEQVLLARKFVDFFEYEQLQAFAHLSPSHKEVIQWILQDDLEALRYFVSAGYPREYNPLYNNTPLKTQMLNVLHKLYSARKDDMNDTTETEYTTLGNLYKRMIITLAFTHASDIKFTICGYVNGNPPSDPLFRYDTYKKFHANGWLKNEVFERLTVPEMMQVLNIEIRDDELEWLSWYVRIKKGGNLSCHAYMPYSGPSYGHSKFYSQAYYAQWNAKYNLSEFNLSYGNYNERRLWMLYEKGAWCGGISTNGVFIQQILGVPAVTIYQPNHMAYMYQVRRADGTAYWQSFYDIFGLVNSSYNSVMGSVLNWGNHPWNDPIKNIVSDNTYFGMDSGSAGYTHYAGDALADWENFYKAEEIRLIADIYTEYPSSKNGETYEATGENAANADKLKEIYNKVVEIQPIHLYGWYGLINAYKEDASTTQEEWLALAKRLMDNLYEYPFPMKDLLLQIEPKLDDGASFLTYSMYLEAAYNKGKQVGLSVPVNGVSQPEMTRAIANKLLGNSAESFEAATFSFDGANAGKLMLGKNYKDKGLAWDYSLDGGKTWSNRIDSVSVTLTAAQIASITEETDIKIHFNGVGYAEQNIYTIDIVKSVLPDDGSATTLFANDLENRVVGVTDLYEWRYSSTDAWTSYKTMKPDLTGDKTVDIRIGYNANRLPSESRTFAFKADNQPDTRKYIPVSRLSLHTVSSQATSHAGGALNTIDANYYTRWHSNWNGADTQRYISFKLDAPTFLKAVEFVPAGGGNGKIIDGTVYGSLDGVSWFKLAERKNLRYPNQCNDIANAMKYTQSFEIEQPRDVLYVKIVADRASNGNWFAARAFNFFEDTTQEHRPAASIIYSTTEPTTGSVTITLNNLFPGEHITILNNGGSDTFVFENNGEFTFEFENDKGVRGSATAIVSWIDREPPEADLEFSTEKPVKDKVVVILNPDEDITVLRDDIKYRIDEQGNVIDIEIEKENADDPEFDISQAILIGYSVDDEGFIIDPLGKKVANINPLRFEFTENGTYVIEYVDRAGNRGSSTIVVNLIDKTLPTAELNYDYSGPTNKDVTVTITFNQEITLVNDSNTYTFTENGEYIFEYIDADGNVYSLTAKVTWIDRTPPTASVEYDKSDSSKAVVKVVDASENISFAEGNGTYEFTENGTFVIEFYDAAGNKGSVTVTVDWLVAAENPPVITPEIPGMPETPETPETPKTNDNTGIIVGLVVGAIVVCGGGAGAFFIVRAFKKKR